MSFVSIKDLLQKAQQGHYAVGAFNCNNMRMSGHCGRSRGRKGSGYHPGQQGAIKYGPKLYSSADQIGCRSVKVPVALHLDHGTSFAQCVQCMGGGFSS